MKIKFFFKTLDPRWITGATDVDQIKVLTCASLINGIIAVLLLVVIVKIGNYEKILVARTNGKISHQ